MNDRRCVILRRLRADGTLVPTPAAPSFCDSYSFLTAGSNRVRVLGNDVDPNAGSGNAALVTGVAS